MFKLVETQTDIQKVLSFCADGFFGAKIKSTLAAYGTNDRFVRTWYEENDRITAVMQLTQGAATVQCTQETDFDSLAALLQFTGANSVIGEKDSICPLPFPVDQNGLLLCVKSINAKPYKAKRLDTEQLQLLHPVLFGEDARQKDSFAFADWFADISHRVRHGLCDCFAVFEGNATVSCACVLYSNDKMGCIGGVATLPTHRSRGLASDCTIAAAQHVVKNGLLPCLACADNGVQKMYEKIGFSVCGEWAECKI